MATANAPNFTRANSTAFKLLRGLGITDPRGLDVEDLAMTRGVFVREGPLTGADAYLVHDDGMGVIRVSNSIREIGRRRFAIAHELGHWLLHRATSQLSLCTGEDIVCYAGSREELEANSFAANVLMPKRFMSERYNQAPSLELIQTAAEDLSTTLTSTAVRIAEVTDDEALVVFSRRRAGTVRWWQPSTRCKLWLESRQPIDERSLTSEVGAGRYSNGPEEVDAASWFRHIPWHESLVVYEEAAALGDYDVTLTILSIGKR